MDTYSVFEGVLRGDVVELLNGEGRQVQAAALAVLHTPLVVILLVGCKIRIIQPGNDLTALVRMQDQQREIPACSPRTCLTH